MIRSTKLIHVIETVEIDPEGRVVYRFWSVDGYLLGSRTEQVQVEDPPAAAPEEEEKR
jgi:hypothetical protein